MSRSNSHAPLALSASARAGRAAACAHAARARGAVLEAPSPPPPASPAVCRIRLGLSPAPAARSWAPPASLGPPAWPPHGGRRGRLLSGLARPVSRSTQSGASRRGPGASGRPWVCSPARCLLLSPRGRKPHENEDCLLQHHAAASAAPRPVPSAQASPRGSGQDASLARQDPGGPCCLPVLWAWPHLLPAVWPCTPAWPSASRASRCARPQLPSHPCGKPLTTRWVPMPFAPLHCGLAGPRSPVPPLLSVVVWVRCTNFH